ncbi:MAG: PD-(D/E)XK nuclease family protein [Synergistota bacterium]|nr:PD-(D/E)XK nuclease family protein [Synergistota bacterium]
MLLHREKSPAVFFPEVRPLVWIWDDLYRAAAEAVGVAARPQIDPPDHWLLIRRVIGRLREGRSDKLPEGLSSSGFVELAGSSIRELLAEAVPADELASALTCPGCPPDGDCSRLDEESGILCRLYRDYIALLAELGLADSSQIPSLGAALLKENPEAARRWAKGLAIRAAGFLSFASGQMAFLRALRDSGADLELWVPECGEGDFYTAIQQFPEAERMPRIDSDDAPPCVSIAAGDLRLSTDTLARELFFWASDEKESHIRTSSGLPFPGWDAIALCAEGDDLDSIVESLVRYGLPFSIREGSPISETALWKSARRSLDLAADSWPSSETADFLSSLPMAPFGFPRREFAGAIPSGEEGWTDFLSRFPKEAGGDAFARATGFARAMRRGGRPDELLLTFAKFAPSRQEMKQLVAKAEEAPRIDWAIREMALVVREAEEKARSLADLRRDLGQAGSSPLPYEEGVAFLGQWAETASVWMPPRSSPAISLFPGSPPALAWSDVWILPGATANRWPGQIRESPLLSDERKEFLHDSLDLGRSHLPLLPEKRSQREALFRRLTACARSLCVLLRPTADGKGRPIAASPFAENAMNSSKLWLRPVGAPLERPLGDILPEGTPVAGGVEPLWRKWPVFGRGADWADFTLWTPEEHVFSLSDLDTFVSCPFRYYCIRIASLEAPPETAYRPDLAGSAMHRLWQMAWEGHLSGEESLPLLVQRLFDQAMAEKYPRMVDDVGLGRFKRELLRKAIRLAEVQETMEKDGLRDGRRDQKREYRLPQIERGAVTFRGRCDRLDLLDDGTAALFDYKGGSSKYLGGSLQLAAYSLALAEEGTTVCATAFLCLKDGKLVGAGADGAPSVFSRLKGDLKGLEDAASTELDNVARAFSTGVFQPKYESQDCGWCAFHSLCRKRDHREDRAEKEDRAP